MPTVISLQCKTVFVFTHSVLSYHVFWSAFWTAQPTTHAPSMPGIFFQFADTDTVPAERYMIVNQHFILL